MRFCISSGGALKLHSGYAISGSFTGCNTNVQIQHDKRCCEDSTYFRDSILVSDKKWWLREFPTLLTSVTKPTGISLWKITSCLSGLSVRVSVVLLLMLTVYHYSTVTWVSVEILNISGCNCVFFKKCINLSQYNGYREQDWDSKAGEGNTEGENQLIISKM